jgi:hypothetical protein
MSVYLRRWSSVLSCLALGLVSFVSASGAPWSVSSPNERVKIAVDLANGALSYTVAEGPSGKQTAMINRSPLGLKLQGHDFASGLRFDSARPQTTIEDNYTLLHGKRRVCQNRANQLTLVFQNAQGKLLEVDFRAYDNGFAFRYRLAGGLEGAQTLDSEATGFGLPAGSKIWCAPSDKPSMYAPGYETYYENGIAAGTASPLGFGWSFPLLFSTGDGKWGLLTEANTDERFCGTRLSNAARDGVYKIAFPDPAEGNGTGPVKPSAALPWEMPWRVGILGDSLGTIVESTLVTDVSAPSALNDASWIKPGRVAWSWWSDNPSPRSASKQKRFVDLAVEMGWEYVLVDANWTIMEDGNVREVIEYAKQKGIGVLLWYNSGGPHNIVTEKPRDCMTYPNVRQFELNLLKEWGVKGVKVDFFQSDKQDVIGLYLAILKDAAEKQIMLNFHGCTLPRGWERKFPHLMSMEGVRGEECYIFDPKYPEAAPIQNAILPFTRNAVGPMDYTPVGFSDNRYPHLTSNAHELALAVLFESGWLHFTDKVEAYLQLPAEPKQFLKEVPNTWDDTRFVDGFPGKFTILAREKGGVWYVAGINAQNQPMETKIQPGAWLPSGKYNLTTIADGADARSFDSQSRIFEKGQSFPMRMAARGGFVAVLKPAK